MTWRGGGGGGGWEIRGAGIGENDNETEGELQVKFNTYSRGGITFSFLFANWKSSGGVIRVQI